MGRAVAERIAAASDLRLVGGTAREAGEASYGDNRSVPIVSPADAGELVAAADVVIDVSSGDALAQMLAACSAALEGRALVIGTTGLDADTERALDALAARAAVLVAPNFSIGVNVLLGLVERAARVLGGDRYDAEIVETHHARKADAPSGTALALGSALASGRGERLDVKRTDGRSGVTGARPAGEIGLHAVRGGGVIGEHRVLFLGESERIELAHAALDRGLFADGAVLAARWIAGRPPGRYTMTEVLGL
jgi:4-hydroxy-tetrahydrodipicolinate reductase